MLVKSLVKEHGSYEITIFSLSLLYLTSDSGLQVKILHREGVFARIDLPLILVRFVSCLLTSWHCRCVQIICTLLNSSFAAAAAAF